MKNLINLILLFVVLIPATAQKPPNITEEVPVERFTFEGGDIPALVNKVAEQIFDVNHYVDKLVIPSELKKSDWENINGHSEPVQYYKVYFRTKDGADSYAVFNAAGELVNYKSLRKNAPVPKFIQDYLRNSEYKNWKISDNVMKAMNDQENFDHQYTVKLVQGKMKKNLHFKIKGDILTKNYQMAVK